MIVIQNQHNLPGISYKVIDQDCWNRLIRKWLGGAQQLKRRFTNAIQNRLAGCNQVCPKTEIVIIPFVKGYPGDLSRDLRCKVTQQSGLAKARRPGQQRKIARAVRTGKKLLYQAWTFNNILTRRRDVEFGREQGDGHVKKYYTMCLSLLSGLLVSFGFALGNHDNILTETHDNVTHDEVTPTGSSAKTCPTSKAYPKVEFRPGYGTSAFSRFCASRIR